MTARQEKCLAAYAVKLLPTVAFTLVYELNVVQHNAISCLSYTPIPVFFCYLFYVPVLFKMRAFNKEVYMRVNTISACFNKHKPL